MIPFLEWLRNESLSKRYDTRAFASLPWDWDSMIRLRVVQPFFYYARDNYVDGKPEEMEDWQASVITLPNLRSIPRNELSAKNIHTGNPPDMVAFKKLLKNPDAWYDDKINQVYEGIRMVGKTPEDFGGRDIRSPGREG